MKTILLVILLLYRVHAHPDELEMLVKNFTVETIDATIVQVIAETGKATTRYEGRYRADAKNMRIDYSKPFPQTVIINGGKLLWYYPESRELWTMSQEFAPVTHPFMQFDAIKSRIVIKSKESVWYGFFHGGYKYILEDTITGTKIELTIDKNKGYPVKKIVYTAYDVEIMREQYYDYQYINKIWFPTTVEVIARTHTGITRNITHYYNINLNVKIPAEIFTLRLPKGVRAKQM